MTKAKLFRIVIMGIMVVLASLQAGGSALAHHPVQQITFYYSRTETIRDGDSWADGNGYHIRNRIDTGILKGGLEGTFRVVYNADIKASTFDRLSRGLPKNGQGVAYGTVEIFSSQQDLVYPIWSGSWSYRIESGKVVSGWMNAVSLDDLWALQVDTVEETRAGILVHSGIIDHNITCLKDYCGIDTVSLSQ